MRTRAVAKKVHKEKKLAIADVITKKVLDPKFEGIESIKPADVYAAASTYSLSKPILYNAWLTFIADNAVDLRAHGGAKYTYDVYGVPKKAKKSEPVKTTKKNLTVRKASQMVLEYLNSERTVDQLCHAYGIKQSRFRYYIREISRNGTLRGVQVLNTMTMDVPETKDAIKWYRSASRKKNVDLSKLTSIPKEVNQIHVVLIKQLMHKLGKLSTPKKTIKK